jgi:hypothetical protein
MTASEDHLRHGLAPDEFMRQLDATHVGPQSSRLPHPA